MSAETPESRPVESRRLLLKMAGAVVAAPLLAACGGPSDSANTGEERNPPKDGDVVVEARQLTFSPEKIEVKPGTRVVWKWTEPIAHNVVGKEFRSQIYSNGFWSHTFTQPGTYNYECTLHQGMVGTVTVK